MKQATIIPTERKQKLEAMLTAYFGVNAEITIRGERAFTVSFEGQNERASKRIASYLASNTQKVNRGYDKDCDMTFIYFSA